MRDNLRTLDLIPLQSPYSDNLITSNDVFNEVGENAIVDWVWIELRDANDNTSIIAGQSALLQRDGDVVAIDGVSSLGFEIPGKSYYVAVKHRNHLGAMTLNPIALSRITTIINLQDSSNDITHGTNSQIDIGNGKLALWSGDVNQDHLIQYTGSSPDTPYILSYVLNDSNNFLNLPTFSITGYNQFDLDLDGNTQYTGANPDSPILLQNILSHPSNILNFSTFIIEEQLPEN